MEKVLEYLKQKRKEFVGYEDQFIDEVIALDKAIVTLKEAMKPKTCKLCAYCEPFNSVCFNDKSPLCSDFVNSEYGCIYWERKDNA